MKRIRLWWLFSILIIVGACTKDYFNSEKIEKAFKNLQWDPEFAIPLVYSSYSIEDLLAKGNTGNLIQVGSDKLVTLVYNSELISLSAEDAIVFNPTLFNVSLSSSLFIPSYFGSSVQFNSNQFFPFDGGPNNKIDSAVLKSGSVQFNFQSTFLHDVTIQLTFPGLSKNGVTLTENINLNYAGTTPTVYNGNVNIEGYTMDLSKNGTSYNELEIQYNIVVNGNGNQVNIGDQISCNGTLENLKFSRLYGYLDVSPVNSGVDSLELSLFSIAQGIGQFKLVNPSIKFTFLNSIGVPLQASFSQIIGVNTNSGVTHDLTGNSDIPSPLPIVSPDLTQIGQTLSGSFTLANSGIVNFINDQPKLITYAVNIGTKPGTTQQCFVLDTSKFRVNAEVSLPLYGSANIFTLRDTIEFSLSEDSGTGSSGGGSNEEGVSLDLVSLTLKSIVSNQFPMDIAIQGYFLNENNIIVDSLLEGTKIIPSAQVDANGRSTLLGKLIIESSYTAERVKKFENIRKIVLVAKATTLNNATTNVKIYSDYQLGVKIGVKTKLTASSK